MIPLIVFYLHIVAAAGAFTREWQEEGLVGGLQAVFFVALLFFVGWAISSFLVKLIMGPEGFGAMLDRDAAGLLLLTLAECGFYYFFLKSDGHSRRNDKGAPATGA